MTRGRVHWLLVFGATFVVAVGFGAVDLPSPYLLAAFVVGIAYALLARPALELSRGAAIGAQGGVVGFSA